MAELRMGLREGTGKGKEYELSPTQYYHRRGGHFVQVANGLASLCASGFCTQVMGWVETPKDTSGKDSWVSSSGDKCFVTYCGDNVFVMPVNEGNASLSTSYIGKGAGIVNTGATHAMIQKAKLGAVTASPLSIVDVDTTTSGARLVFVKVKPGKIQANG